jgi:hypothetical protein
MSDITLRLDKGTPLTNQEVDDNFDNLNADKYEAGDSPDFADITADSIQLSGGTGSQGLITWNTDDSTIDLPLNSDVTLQLGQESVFYGKAQGAISNGQPVMFAGAQGGHLLFTVADMDAAGFIPDYIVGVATQDMANNEFGFATSFGKVNGLNTSGYSEGDLLFLDPDNPGSFVTSQPESPSHAILLAAVTRSHPTQGTILVRVSSKPDLGELCDVEITSVADGELIVYSGTNSRWENKTIAEAGLATAAQGALADSAIQPSDNISELTNDSGYITGNQTITLSGDVSGSGTTSINVTVANDSHSHSNYLPKANNSDYQLKVWDNRGTDTSTDLGQPAAVFEFKQNTTDSLFDGGVYHGILTLQPWSDTSGGNTHQLAFTDNGNLHLRSVAIGGTWPTNWSKIWHSGNDGSGSGLDADLLDGQQGTYYAAASSLSNYLPLSGGTITGNLGIGTSPSAKLDVLAGSDQRLQFTTLGTDPFISAVNGANSAYKLLQLNGSQMRLMTGGSERMRIDASGNVGIGTSSPQNNSGRTTLTLSHPTNGGVLELYGPAAARQFLMYNSGSDTLFETISGSSGDLVFRPNGSERMRIDSSGNVGIGTTSPSTGLHIKDDDATLLLQDTTTGFSTQAAGITLTCSDGSGNPRTDVQRKVKLNGDALTFTRGASDTEHLRIDSSGNVGIGTTSPSKTLTVSGTGLRVQSTASADFYSTGQDALVVNNGTANLKLWNNGAERMRIDFSGNVGIGESDPSGYWVQADNLVVGGAGNEGITIKSSSAGNGRIVFTDTKSSTAGYSDGGGIAYSHPSDAMLFQANGAERMRIDSSGNLLVGTTAQYGQGLSLNANATAYFRKSSDAPLTLRRDTTDGSILNFYKDSTTVGSIGVAAGNANFNGVLNEVVYSLTGTALDPDNGTIQTKTLSANTTLTDSLTAGQSMTLMIDDGSAYTITWPTITWLVSGGSAPTLETTGYTAIVLWKVGSTLYGKY